MPKVTSGVFLRAESFFNFASYIDSIGGAEAYGGKSLHVQSHGAQFIIATHSPILLSYPGAAVYSLDGPVIERVAAAATEHVQLTRDFLNAPERYLKRLLAPDREA
ncbi:MAG: hypothetical protein LC753_08435 [Acidobacteria bacterium]|nr:hypothetical protein [Acidobacteriota bacterium]MCA1650298.1 hypothetical protein [Acidobacteriota bacterium]